MRTIGRGGRYFDRNWRAPFRGAIAATIRYACADSPLGRMLIAATDRGVCSIQFARSDGELIEGLKREFPFAVRKPPSNLDAWGAYQRGLWHISKFSSEDNTLAQKFFRQAIELDPNFSGGYGGLAVAHTQAVGIYQTYEPDENFLFVYCLLADQDLMDKVNPPNAMFGPRYSPHWADGK